MLNTSGLTEPEVEAVVIGTENKYLLVGLI